MPKQTSFSSLPVELHLRILSLAGWKSIVALSETSRVFNELCSDSTLWREITRRTYDLKSYDVVRNNQWKAFFAALLHSGVYAWGGGTHNMFSKVVERSGINRDAHEPRDWGMEDHQWVDVQTGGWGTVLLDTFGDVYMAGRLHHARTTGTSPEKLELTKPAKIVQMSMGRQHVVMLSNRGEVFAYYRTFHQPMLVKFDEFDYVEDDPTKDPSRNEFAHGSVRRVVAGWGGSAAIIEGHGVVFWRLDGQVPRREEDTIRIATHKVPFLSEPLHDNFKSLSEPSTDSINVLHRKSDLPPELIQDVVVGEDWLLALTNTGRVFVTDITGDHSMLEVVPPAELVHFRVPDGQKPFSRISGSFRNFAAFNDGDVVYLGSHETALAAISNAQQREQSETGEIEHEQDDKPEILAGLQNRGIVDMAFGDWHHLAMDKHGKIYSWGRESRSCGSLGHGRGNDAKARGVKFSGVPLEGILDEPTEIIIRDAQSDDHRRHYAYKICAGGWHSCALICKLPAGLATGEDVTMTTSTATDGHDQTSSPLETDPHSPPSAGSSTHSDGRDGRGPPRPIDRARQAQARRTAGGSEMHRGSALPRGDVRPGGPFFGLTMLGGGQMRSPQQGGGQPSSERQGEDGDTEMRDA